MDCKVWSVKPGVWSTECGWRVECRVQVAVFRVHEHVHV